MNVQFNLQQITYEDFMAYAKAAQTLDTTAMYRLASTALVSWDYDTPTEDGIAALPSLMESAAVLGQFNKLIENLQQELEDDESITVDLSKWNAARWADCEQARADEKWTKAVSMMKEVCKGKGVSSDPLPAIVGVKMWRAMTQKYLNAIMGKL